MPNSVLYAVLANAIVSAEPEAGAIAERLRHALGRNWRWIGPLSRRYCKTFGGTVRPRRREVITFLRQDEGFGKAWKKHQRQISIQHWTTTSQEMRPVAAARAWSIPAIETVAALAKWCGLTVAELFWFADLKGIGSGRLEHYHYRFLTKSNGGIRLIESPKDRLKSLQRKVLAEILDGIPVHPTVHGFVRGRSIQSFANPHAGRHVVLRMDLETFFPSISGARAQALFRTMGYPEPVADLLGGIVTNAVPQRAWREAGVPATFDLRSLYARPHLPQGAPTSPALANFASYRLDCRLAGLARAGGVHYTRYADDLAFSGDRELENFAAQVAVIVREEGFSINHRKTRIMRRSVRQQLAGLVINQRINPKREDFDQLKAILTNCARHGPMSQNREGLENFREHLAGRISFIASVHSGKGTRLRAIFDGIRWP